MAAKTFPDGIDESACSPGNPWKTITLRVGVFALVLGAALVGLFGGRRAETRAADFPPASVAVSSNETLRNGNFFETRFTVSARQAIDDAVIAIPEQVWHQATINAIYPEPSESDYADGYYRLHFGRLDAGDTLAAKIDGQLNPPLFGVAKGHYIFADGDREYGRLDARLRVIP